MYILKTITYSTLWGDQRLYAYDGNKEEDSIGIVYSVSGIDDFDCEINGRTTLKNEIRKNPELFGLLPKEEYPVIIAFDACKESVSFQIHPTDAYARNKLNLKYGKSEAWYFIEPPEEGWVNAENKKGNKQAVLDALEKNDFSDTIGHFPVQQNDLVYIRSGTVHALSKGSLIYEIQQSTNITYRLYDYDRIDPRTNKKRQLHIQESLDNLDSSLKVKKEEFLLNKTIENREFDLTHTILTDEYTNNGTIASAISVLSGELEIEHHTLKQGQSCLVMPNETVHIQRKAEVMIANPKPYWREI